MKKVLLIGGTGTISRYVTERLAKDKDVELYLLNRGNRNLDLPDNIHIIQGDINQFDDMKEKLKDFMFDCVCNFVVYTPQQAKMNIELFKEKTKQFIFISTVVTYQRDDACFYDEDSKQGNAHSLYGQLKEQCEKVFLDAYHEINFPVTIVRPSQTYSQDRIPLSVKGKHCWSVVDRMLAGKEVIIHGDGQSMWACTHAYDFAKGFCALVGNERALGEAYQIVNNEELLTWDMIYMTLAQELNVEYKPVYLPSALLSLSKTYDLKGSIYGDKRSSCLFDVSKIKDIASEFNCEINIQKGIQMFLDYMNEHPELKIRDEKFDNWCDIVIQSYHEFEEKISQIM